MYLGVDGGGSKTAFVLIDGEGKLVAEHFKSGSYYLDIGLDNLKDLLESGVNELLGKAQVTPADIDYAFFGLPAYGEESALQSKLDELPAGVFPARNYRCDNDMVCAWAGSLACEDGINIVAGTGSIGFGRYRGKGARSGGWGEVFGDEGSAYWIACRGLQLFAKMSDGRAHRGPLYDIIHRDFNLAQDLDLSTMILNSWGSDRARIAKFSRTVAEAAKAGDSAAIAIYSEAALELVSMVTSIARQLQFPSEYEIPVSFSGGVFNTGKLILEPFTQGLHISSESYRICKPRFSPALGAAYFAGILDRNDAIMRKLESSWD